MKVYLAAPVQPDDAATKITYRWARELQKWLKKQKHITPVCFLGVDAIRVNVENALKKDSGRKGVFIFIDHGEKNRLLGADNQPLIDMKNISLLKKKLVYAVACKSASTLGHKAVKDGAAGYIGFTDSFHILPGFRNIFGQCFLSGIIAIVGFNKELLEARETVENKIEAIIQKLNGLPKQSLYAPSIEASLYHNLDCMVCLGAPGWKM